MYSWGGFCVHSSEIWKQFIFITCTQVQHDKMDLYYHTIQIMFAYSVYVHHILLLRAAIHKVV